MGRVDNAEGKILIDTGAQVSLIKRGAAVAPMTKPDLIIRGISGRTLKIYGRQKVTLMLKPGVPVKGNFVVSNLPRGYLAVLGCDILKEGSASIDITEGVLRMSGNDIWLNRLHRGESVPDSGRQVVAPRHEKAQAPTTTPEVVRVAKRQDSCIENYVYNAKDVTIPARSEKLVQLKLSKFRSTTNDNLEGSDVVVEPVGLTIQGVYLAQVLTKIVNNKCWAKAVNVSGEEVSLTVNSKFGIVESVSNDTIDKVKRKIVLIADSHGRGIRQLLEERLPGNFELSSWFVPNAFLYKEVCVLSSDSEIQTSDSPNTPSLQVLCRVPVTLWLSHPVLFEATSPGYIKARRRGYTYSVRFSAIILSTSSGR
ncbi:hypothetical protein J6590_083227 [Homalodisca vitripennis]|nr:hypothetical protein J6590_083227 [Homalodisca vitripennis]